jgi:hypothetical protein
MRVSEELVCSKAYTETRSPIGRTDTNGTNGICVASSSGKGAGVSVGFVIF